MNTKTKTALERGEHLEQVAGPIKPLHSTEKRVSLAWKFGSGMAQIWRFDMITLPQIEEKERQRIQILKAAAQQSIAEWLIPLLDQSSTQYAPNRFPNLKLVVSGTDDEMDPNRPMPQKLSTLLAQTPESRPRCNQIF
jgi:hypothetical protein